MKTIIEIYYNNESAETREFDAADCPPIPSVGDTIHVQLTNKATFDSFEPEAEVVKRLYIYHPDDQLMCTVQLMCSTGSRPITTIQKQE